MFLIFLIIAPDTFCGSDQRVSDSIHTFCANINWKSAESRILTLEETVELSAMRRSDHQNHEPGFLNLISDAVVAAPDFVYFIRTLDQFPLGLWIFPQRAYLFHDLALYAFWLLTDKIGSLLGYGDSVDLWRIVH